MKKGRKLKMDFEKGIIDSRGKKVGFCMKDLDVGDEVLMPNGKIRKIVKKEQVKDIFGRDTGFVKVGYIESEV